MSTDPTMELVKAIKRGDKKDWGRIIENVPIFVPHKWYERTVGDHKEAMTVLYGDPEPAKDSGWKLVYEVTESDLPVICQQVNKQFEENGTPMSLLLGHTKTGAAQEEQPPLVGYGAIAKTGTFGPKKTPAILTNLYYRKGYGDIPAEYPQRSPEFKQSTKVISAVAMIKTTPRLPMGMHAYGESRQDLYLYGEGFMAEENKDKTPEQKEGEKPSEKVADGDKNSVKTGTEKTPPSPQDGADNGALAPLTAEEAKMCARYAAHLEQHHPVFKFMCDQAKKYMASGAAAAPSATNGVTPATPVGHEKKHSEEGEELMEDTEKQRLYEERIQKLELENATLYAEGQVKDLRVKNHVKIKDPAKLKERFVKARMSGKDAEAACKELRDEILNNYAREDAPPIGRDFMPHVHRDQEDAPERPKPDMEWTPELTAEVTKYAEENKIDILKDGGWEQAVDAFVEREKKRQEKKDKQTAAA